MILHNGTRGTAQEFWFAVVTGVMYPLPTDVTPSPSPTPAPDLPPISPTRTPSPGPVPVAPGAAAAGVNVAAAVFGTLGGLVALSLVIVFFLPTAGFVMGGSRVVPADFIKSAAFATWGGVASVGRGVAGMVRGGGASGLPTSAVYTSASQSEGSALLRGAGAK